MKFIRYNKITKEKIMNKKTKKETEFDFKDFIIGFIENFIKKIGSEIIEDVKEKSKEIVEQAKRKATGTTLIFIGLIFFLIGFSIFLEKIINFPGTGYLVIGTTIFLTGLFISIKK